MKYADIYAFYYLCFRSFRMRKFMGKFRLSYINGNIEELRRNIISIFLGTHTRMCVYVCVWIKCLLLKMYYKTVYEMFLRNDNHWEEISMNGLQS